LHYKIPLPNRTNHLLPLPLLLLRVSASSHPCKLPGVLEGFTGVVSGPMFNLELSRPQVRKWWCGWEIAFGSTWDAREGIAFGSTWDALRLWAATELPRVFAKAKNSSSSYVQRVQLPCARSKSVLDHKRSSSTTTWRVGRGGSCCYVSVCTRNFTLHIKAFEVHRSSFQTAPNRNKGGTQRSRQL